MATRLRSRIRRTALAAALTAAALVTTSCVAADPGGSGGSDGPLIIAVPASIESWDPIASADDNALLFLQTVYSSLLSVEPDLTPGPSVATEWAYNDDNTVLSLTLAEGLEFSDGTPLDAEAVKANLERGKASEGGASFSLASVAEVTVVSPTQVDVTLSAPDPGLLYALGRTPGLLVSPAAFDSVATAPVGSGPYVLDLDASVTNSKYVFTRSETYGLETEYGFDSIEIRPMPDFNAMVSATTSGQVDVAGVPASAVPAAAATGFIDTQAMPTNFVAMWLADREGTLAPELADVRVRQAINYALDSESMIEAITEGYGSRITQLFAVNSPAWVQKLNQQYEYDPEKARELLAEAGYPDGFTLQMPSENTFQPAYYPIVQQQLGAVGITVEYTPVSADQIFPRYLGAEFPAFMWSYSPTDNWFDIQNLLAPDGVYNPFHVDDPKVGEYIEAIRAESGDASALYQELNTYVVDQALFAPIMIDPFFLTWKTTKVNANVPEGQIFLDLADFQPAG